MAAQFLNDFMGFYRVFFSRKQIWSTNKGAHDVFFCITQHFKNHLESCLHKAFLQSFKSSNCFLWILPWFKTVSLYSFVSPRFSIPQPSPPPPLLPHLSFWAVTGVDISCCSDGGGLFVWGRWGMLCMQCWHKHTCKNSGQENAAMSCLHLLNVVVYITTLTTKMVKKKTQLTLTHWQQQQQQPDGFVWNKSKVLQKEVTAAC